jgi:tetratricopeptide (TPR) repeat protein
MYEEDGDEILALRNYNKAILKAPLRGDIRLRKAQLYIKQKRFHEAEQTLDDMTLSCPDYFEGYHMKIRLFNDMGEYDKALKVLAEAKRNFPEDSGFILDHANLLSNQNRFDEALIILEAEENREGNRLDKREAAVERARIYALKGDMRETINQLIKAGEASMEMVPPQKDAVAEYFLLNCYINIEEYDKALVCARSLKDMEEMDFYKIAAYYYEPYCLQKMQKEKEAKELYQVGVETLRNHTLEYPQHLDAYVFRVLCLKDLKMYEKALELVDYIIRVKDDSGEFYAVRGMVLSEMGREEEAKEARAKSRSLGGMMALLPANKE